MIKRWLKCRLFGVHTGARVCRNCGRGIPQVLTQDVSAPMDEAQYVDYWKTY